MNKTDGTDRRDINFLDEDDAEVGFLDFVPPPPRGLFLDDGVTECDLCTWAMQGKPTVTFQRKGLTGELGWILTLVIVSVSSAIIGAAVMIVITHCKRKLKVSAANESERGIALEHRPVPAGSPRKDAVGGIATISGGTTQGMWSWLSKTNHASTNLNNGSHVMENHYTHIEGQYNVEEALYDELDKESSGPQGNLRIKPAYHNSAFTNADLAISQTYYSDLSLTHPERTYETVLTTEDT